MEQRLVGASRRVGSRFTSGALVYFGLNVLLIAAEAQWHLLYRLTLWDAAQLRTLAPLLAELIHH
jgi:hypothetical protein